MTTAIAAAPALADQPPRPQPAPPSSKFLDYVNRPAPRQPTRLILYATEGWGKTSFAAMAPEPIFLLTRGETGLWTLINSGRLPGAVAHFPKPAEKWADMFQALSLLIAQPHNFKSLVIDTINGAETLLHEDVCDSAFNGDWTESGPVTQPLSRLLAGGVTGQSNREVLQGSEPSRKMGYHIRPFARRLTALTSVCT